MATRQYIGARYVPKFYENSVDGSTQWESNVVYEPLTWVTLTNGHIYLSRKQVPATVGTPASNADYWLDVGSYNGFIEHLQDQIDVIDTHLDRLDEITGRRFILIGDSYGIGTGATEADGWIAQFKSACGLSGDNVYSYGYGGSGFVGNVLGYTFLDLITALENIVDNPDTITDIVVCGGFNDFGKANVNAAVRTFVTYCTAHYPRAVIYIGMVGYSAIQNDTLRQHITQTIFDYYAGKPAGKLHVLTDVEYALRGYDNLFNSDGIHPTALGYWALSQSIISAVFGGSGFCEYHTPNGITTTITDLTNTTSTFIEKIFKHEILMQFGYSISRFKFNATTGRPSANTWMKVADLTGSIARGVAANTGVLDQYSRTIEFLVHDTTLFGGDGYGIMHGAIAIMDSSIYIKLNDINPSTGAFYNLNNIDTVSPWGNVMFNLLEV